MAKEPSVFGFPKPKAAILSRVADREGLVQRSGSGARYPSPIGGFFVYTGVLTEVLNEGSSATVAEIDLDENGDKVYTGQEHEVYDLKLNSGESIPADTIIDYVPMSGGRFKWITAYCAASDTLPA